MTNVCKLACVCLVAFATFAAKGDEKADDKAIRDAIVNYGKALNASDVDGVLKQFAADVVVMAPNNPLAVGRDVVRQVYAGVFKAVKLDLKFEIDEVKLLSDKWAYARSRSNFTVKVLGTDLPPQPDANQELFVFQKEQDGQWRIARYSYSSSNPAKK